MSIKQRNAGYLLPDPVRDYELICVTLKIPNHRLYRAAFRGALKQLTNWWNWEKSYDYGDTRASEAATYWRGILEEHLKIEPCRTPSPCPEPDPCPDCEDPEDFIEDELGLDLEELEMLLDCYKHAVGDIKMHVEPSAGAGWLLCDGASYEIAQYPELYDLLMGKTPSTETTFAVPNFSLRSPMGVGYDDAIGTLQSLQERGALTHTLTEAEIPAHSHQVEDHAHEVGGHVHPLNPDQHGHGIPEHNHSIPAHTHLLSNPTHSHDIEVRENSAIGAGQRLLTSSGAGVASTRSTLPFGPVSIQPTAPTNTGNWSGNTSSITIQVDQNEPFDSGMASPNTNSVGGGEAHPNVHPVLGVYFFIFAGCAMSSEDCL